MARREHHAHLEVADAEDLAVVNVNLDVRRGRKMMHRDRRSGQLCELECAAAMVDVSVRIDDQIELQSAVGEDGEVTLDLIAERIDPSFSAVALRHAEIGFAFAVIEFLEEHVTNYSGVAAVAISAVRGGNEKRAT